MAILQKLKSLLGFDDSGSERGNGHEVGVTVEREGSQETADRSGATDVAPPPSAATDESGDADSDSATDEPTPDDSEPAAAGSSAAGSTDSLVEEAEGAAEAAEPAEATGPTETDAAPTEEKTPDEEPTAGEDPSVEDETPAAEAEEPAESEADEEPAESEADEEPAESEADAEPAEESESVDVIKGIGPAYADRLADAGVETVDDLAAADAAELESETDISEKRIQGWIDKAEVR